MVFKMTVYLSLFATILLLSPLYFYSRRVYLWLIVLCLFLISALRGVSVGADTFGYLRIFQTIGALPLPNSLLGWILPLGNQRFEAGFILYFKLLNSIYPDFRIVIFVTAAMVSISLGFFLEHFKCSYPLALTMYFAIFFPFTLNALRQAIAMALCMLALIELDSKRYKSYALFTILAASFHSTAWLFFIALLLKKLNLTRRNAILLMIIGGIVFFNFELIYGNVSSYSMELNSFSNGVSTLQGNSVNLVFQIILCLVLVILLIKNGTQGNFENLFIWFLILSIVIYFVSFKFNQLSRIALYFTICQIVVIPNLVGKLRIKTRLVTTVGLIGVGIIYFIVIQTLRPDWSGIVPYVMWH